MFAPPEDRTGVLVKALLREDRRGRMCSKLPGLLPKFLAKRGCSRSSVFADKGVPRCKISRSLSRSGAGPYQAQSGERKGTSQDPIDSRHGTLLYTLHL